MTSRMPPGTQREVDSIAERWGQMERAAYLDEFQNAEAWLTEERSKLSWLETRKVIEGLALPGTRVLDVGVGSGRTSLLLSELKFSVTASDPSPEMCALLREATRRWNLELEGVVCAPGEAIADISDAPFDLVVFNASFHHLDDAPSALSQAVQSLNPGGAVALINEPLLRFYTSRDRWFKRLETDPEGMGHYGGNEHVYRHGEYISFLQDAGLQVHVDLHIRNTDYRRNLRHLADSTVDGVPVYSPRAMLLRAVAFGLIREFADRPKLVRILQRGSLLPSSYVGYKPS